jgi:hypothetical protein
MKVQWQVKRYPEFYANYPFENWLNFMMGAGLVDEKDGDLEISLFGRDFHVYLVEQRLLETKPW